MKLELIDHNKANAQEAWMVNSQAKLTAEQIYNWGNETCFNDEHRLEMNGNLSSRFYSRKDCRKCWDGLREASK